MQQRRLRRMEALRRFHAAVPEKWKTFWTVGRGDCGLDFDPGHMDIITDNRAQPLWAAMADWMDEQKNPAGG